MKRDLQNYYRILREKIKNVDAQVFVAQLERKKDANPAFSMISLWMIMGD
jgi:hypothetical protein